MRQYILIPADTALWVTEHQGEIQKARTETRFILAHIRFVIFLFLLPERLEQDHYKAMFTRDRFQKDPVRKLEGSKLLFWKTEADPFRFGSERRFRSGPV